MPSYIDEASQAPGTSPTLPQPAPSRARTLQAGKRWALRALHASPEGSAHVAGFCLGVETPDVGWPGPPPRPQLFCPCGARGGRQGDEQQHCANRSLHPSTWVSVLSASMPRVPLRGEGSCGVGGASRDSARSGATEEGLTSRGPTGCPRPRRTRAFPPPKETFN